MNKITYKITWDVDGNVLEHMYAVIPNIAFEKLCGASNEEKTMFKEQNSLFKQLSSQAQQIFGYSSQVFNDIMGAFAPIVAAGPNQKGFSPTEDAALRSEAITDTGRSYEHARAAVGNQQAAFGGGNMALPSGVVANQQAKLANAGAAQTASQLTNIELQNYETGRKNFFAASDVLGGATNVFNPAIGAGNSAVGAGSAAEQTAHSITEANNSWENLVAGVIGGVAQTAIGAATGGASLAAGAGHNMPGQNGLPDSSTLARLFN